MKTCPYCHKQLGDSALRCRYCRRPLSPRTTRRAIPKRINLEPGYPPWSLLEVALLWALVFLAHLSLAHTEIVPSIVSFLRSRYFILIKEPALQFQIFIFISTFILKLSAIAIIWVILKIHKTGFINGLCLNRRIEKRWLWYFAVFFAFAAVSRLIVDSDPLMPNLPIYFFFKESSVIGSAVVMLSLIIVAPVLEEIFFRGFVYPGLNKKLDLYASVLITTLLFTAVHIPQCLDYPFILISIFLGGLFLTTVRAVTRSTLLAILLHSLYNISVIVVGLIKFLILGY